jgi:ankyrin repeat protein
MGIKYNDQQKELIEMARSGNETGLQALIATGFDVDCELKYGSSALMIAASRGNCGVVQMLLQAGAKVNRRNRFGVTALMEACEKGHHEVVRSLVALGADVNMPHNNGTTVLLAAAFRRDIKTIKILLELGADKEIENFDGWSAKRWAESEANPALLEVFGIKPSEDPSKGSREATSPETPETGALNAPKQTTIVTVNDTFWTAFMRAASAGDVATVKRLAEEGVEINGQSPNGTTALIAAAKNGQKEAVTELIELGADLTIVDSEGLSALDWASKKGQVLIAKTLQERVESQTEEHQADNQMEESSAH